MRLPVAIAAACLAAVASASPRETVTFPSLPCNGVFGSGANAVVTHAFVGGYDLGVIQVSGTLTSQHTRTWRSDTRIMLTSPGGASLTLAPFASGGTFTTLPFSATMILAPGADPAGVWTVRTFEVVDDGGEAAVDALCTLTITTTDDPPPPPPSVALGTLVSPGAEPPQGTQADVAWFQFHIAEPAQAFRGTFLDIETSLTTTVPLNPNFPSDTVIGLFDEAGGLIAFDDDGCDGFTSQFSFGAGTRPPVGLGDPFDGADGVLPAGRYYLAVAAYGTQFQETYWQFMPSQVYDVVARVRINTNVGGSTRCPESITPPSDASEQPGGSVSFIAEFTEDRPLTFRWEKDGQPLADGPTPGGSVISGSTTLQLHLASITQADAGDYRCIATNTCGSTPSPAATLTVTPACDPDLNCDGVPDQDDVACIILAVAGDISCFCQADPDFNRDGVPDQGDVADVILVVAGAPCP